MQDDRVYSHSFFSPNQSSIYALYVEETGIQRCFAGQQWGPESREYFILLQVLSGKGRIQIGQKTYPAVPNDVFLFYPGDHVCYYSDQSAPLEYTWVGFKGGDAQMLLAQTEFSHLKPMLHFPGDVPFSNDLQELYTYHGPRSVDSVRMIACLYRFFGDLLEGAQKKKIKTDSTQVVLENAIDYITQNYAQPLTLQELADAVCVSPSWLYRSFIRYLHISPMRYLSEYRIEQSMILLRDPSLSISSVAYATGFRDPFYFSKVFKSMKNCSPTAFRDQNRKPEDD